MRASRSVIVGSLTLVTAAAGVAVSATPALAAPATRYVATTGSDAGTCANKAAPCKTIQYAVGQAAPGDTVSIAAGTYRERVELSRQITLVGATTGRTVITGPGQPGQPSVVVLGPPPDRSEPVSFTLRNLDISGNKSAPGLVALFASVRLIDSHVDRNLGSGVLTYVTAFTATGSTVSSNAVDPDADDQSGSPADGAGIVADLSVVSTANTTIAGNAGAGVAEGYGQLESSALRVAAAPTVSASTTISRSTVSGNGFGGVVSVDGLVAVDTSTVSGNSRGGIVIAGPDAGAAVSASTVVGTTPEEDFPQIGGLVNATAPSTARTARSGFATRTASLSKRLTGELARQAEGVRRVTVRGAAARVTAAAPSLAAGKLSVTGSVVATQGKGVPDCSGAVTTGGFNASSDPANSCAFATAKKDLVRTAPKLGALAANGGPTRTHLPLAGSPLRDKIPGAQPADQRGVVRPQGSRSDIGAVEAVVTVTPVRITTKSLPDGQVGDSYRKQLTATGGDGSYAWSLAKGSSLPDGLSLSAAGVISGTPTEAGRFALTVVADGATKRFTLVIDAAEVAPAAPAGNGQDPIAETGAPSASLISWGSALVLSGFAVMLAAGRVGRRPGRHRPAR